jgi:hypothetical protein
VTWYPDRLFVANVAGRALISDHYIIGEWRRDPWKGFNLPEGAWTRTKGHQYEPTIYHGPNKKYRGQPAPEFVIARVLRDLLAKFPPPSTVLTTDGTRYRADYIADDVVRFDGTNPVWVNRSFLASLVSLINGEPAEWRGGRESQPVHALDERGKWLGAIMPIRMMVTPKLVKA